MTQRLFQKTSNEDFHKSITSDTRFASSSLENKQVDEANDVERLDTNNKMKNAKKKRDEIELIIKENFETPWFKSMARIIYSPHIILKIFLFTYLCASTGYASYLTIQSIMSYLEYAVSTISRTYFETPTDFPKVTFCNVNYYQTKYAYYMTSDLTLNSTDEEKKSIGHYLEDILIECWFNNVECNASDFVWSFDEAYGNCYTFNTGHDSQGNKIDLKKTSIVGPDFGLGLTFYVNVYEEFLLDGSTSLLGGVLRIGNSSYSTFYANTIGILLTPGLQTNIVVEREFKSILPQPYSNCKIDSNSPKFLQGLDLYNLISQTDYAYTQQMCFLQCYQKIHMDKFNCSVSHLLSFYNGSACTSEQVIPLSDFLANVIKTYCFPLCPLECDHITYRTSLSSSQLNGFFYMDPIKQRPNLLVDFMNRTLNSQSARESFVNVNIFYESLSYTLTNELPQMDAVYLLGAIGGNLGLFLGISVFSICEIIVTAIEIFFVLSVRNGGITPMS
jgi:hypothetical protein